MDELISEYNSVAIAYLNKLIEYAKEKPDVIIPDNSSFKSKEQYLLFRENSLKQLISSLQKLTTQLDKYGKYKTLDPKIVRMTEKNEFTNSKFYDYAIGIFNYRNIEPNIYRLIDNHSLEFSRLSNEIIAFKK